MATTVRQAIMAILTTGPATALEISGLAGIPEKEVYDHLEHIRKACLRQGKRLRVEPSRCRDCGFVFTKRDRLRKPGRCPRCHGSFITAPIFTVSG